MKRLLPGGQPYGAGSWTAQAFHGLGLRGSRRRRSLSGALVADLAEIGSLKVISRSSGAIAQGTALPLAGRARGRSYRPQMLIGGHREVQQWVSAQRASPFAPL